MCGTLQYTVFEMIEADNMDCAEHDLESTELLRFATNIFSLLLYTCSTTSKANTIA